MFKPALAILSAALSLAGGVASASPNPFLGKWQLVASKSRMPDEIKVQRNGGNTYAFDLGGGVETIVVDGSYQPGSGGSLLSVEVQAPDTWIVKRKRDGRLDINATWNLSSDGNTLTDNFRQFQADGATTSVDYVYRRVGEGSGFAGDWQSIEETVNSPYVLELNEIGGGGLSIADPVEHRTKNVAPEVPDGADAAAHADQGPSSSFRRADERTLVVTDKVNGTARVTEEFVLSADSKVLTMTVQAASLKRPYVLVFQRG